MSDKLHEVKWQSIGLDFFDPGLDFGPGAFDFKRWYGRMSGRIGMQPSVFRVSDVARALNMAEWPEGFSSEGSVPGALYLIRNTVALHDADGIASIRAIECEIKLRDDDEGLNAGLPVRIELMLPSPEFESIGGAGIAGDASARLAAELAPNGAALSVMSAVQSAAAPVAPMLRIKELELSASGNLNLALRLQRELYRCRISATGIGDWQGKWTIFAGGEPLVGRPMCLWTVIAVPESRCTMELAIRMSVIARVGVFTKKIDSKSERLTIRLDELPGGTLG